MRNLGAILEKAGLGYADIVKTTVFVVDLGDFAAVNAVYERFFDSEPPARSCVQVRRPCPRAGWWKSSVSLQKGNDRYV